MRTLSVEEFHHELKAQGTSGREHLAFICPMCGTVQSEKSLIDAGAGEDFDAVERFLAFSCVGRWRGDGSPRNTRDGKPCNWTLGGLFRTHTLEVLTEEGEAHPRFEPATAAQARELEASPIPTIAHSA